MRMPSSALRRLLIIVALAPIACGGRVLAGAEPPSNGDAGGDGVETSREPAGAARCADSHEIMQLDVLDPGRRSHCFGGIRTADTFRLSGVVTSVESSTIKVDGCPSSPPCAPNEYEVVAAATGLDLRIIPKGGFVDVSFEAQGLTECSGNMVIKSRPEWDGAKNPAGPGERLYLVASNGRLAFGGSPLTIELVPLGCGARESNPCAPVPDDHYALRFFAAGAASSPTVFMGTQRAWSFDGQSFTIRNIRAIEPGTCDAHLRWSWYVAAR